MLTPLTNFQKLTKSFVMVNSSGDNTRKDKAGEKEEEGGERERTESEGGAGGEREGGERKRTGKVVQSQFSSQV